jgi:hypothetical protein
MPVNRADLPLTQGLRVFDGVSPLERPFVRRIVRAAIPVRLVRERREMAQWRRRSVVPT